MSTLASFFFGHWLFHPLWGRGYQFWSGIAGCFIGIGWVGGLAAYLKHHNCQVRHCWRLQWRQTAAGDHVCRKHHPEPAKTVAQVHHDHHEAAGDPPNGH